MARFSRRSFLLQSPGLALAAGVAGVRATASDQPVPIQEFSRGGMVYRRLGHSDLYVSMLSFGSHTNPAFKRRAQHGGELNEEGQALRDRRIARAFDFGVNMVDTYENAGQWKPMARLVRTRRDQVLVSICRQFPDFVGRNIQDPKRLLLVSKVTTVAWGIAITGFAFFVGAISDTVIESINKVGSAFYGPILASFLVGVLSKRATAPGILVGLPAGVLFNLFLWFTAPGVHWMWWNLFGFLVTAAVAMVISRMTTAAESRVIKDYVLDWQVMRKYERSWLPAYGMLVAYFALMLIILIAL